MKPNYFYANKNKFLIKIIDTKKKRFDKKL